MVVLSCVNLVAFDIWIDQSRDFLPFACIAHKRPPPRISRAADRICVLRKGKVGTVGRYRSTYPPRYPGYSGVLYCR